MHPRPPIDQFWIWMGANLPPINWVLGTLGITLGLGLVETVAVIAVGNALGCAAFGLFCVVGHRTGVNMMVLVYAADYSRFVRRQASERRVFWATGLGMYVPTVWLAALGAAVASGGGGTDPSDFELGLQALRRLGASPRGYRAPLWRQTHDTLALVARAGMLYDSSLMDDDRRYVMGDVVELPVHWSLDDWEQYAFLPAPDVGQSIETPANVLELWTGELDAMRQTGSLCLVCCHPFLSGRPSRLAAIERFVAFARDRGDVALLTCEDVAERAR